MGKLRSKISTLYHRVVHIQAEPHHIAGGAAVGVFYAWSPLWGFHMILCLLTSTMLGVSRIASLVTVQLSNPITMGAIYYLTYKLGDLLVRPFLNGGAPVPQAKIEWTVSTFLNMAGGLLVRTLIGGTIIGGCASVAVYFLVRRAVQLARKTRAEQALKHPAGEPPPA